MADILETSATGARVHRDKQKGGKTHFKSDRDSYAVYILMQQYKKECMSGLYATATATATAITY